MPKSKESILPKVKSESSNDLNFTEEDFRTVCDRMPGVVAVYNINSGEYLYVNLAIKKLLGYSPEDFLSGGVAFASTLIHPDDYKNLMSKNSAALNKANKQNKKDI